MHARNGYFDLVIYTSKQPDPSRESPAKKAFIEIKMPMMNYYFDRETEKFKKMGLLALGLTTTEEDDYILTITSASKVIRAINILTSMPEYKNSKNFQLFQNLNNYKQECQEILKLKGERIIAPKSKSSQDFEKVITAKALSKSSNVTSVIKEKSLTSQKKPSYVHKENISKRKISEIEAFNGCCYRLLLGNRHPRMITLHDEHGERSGVAAEMLVNYTSIEDHVKTFGKLNKNQLIKNEVIKVWVAAYTEEETDLHTGNYGMDITGFCVKIDDDRSTWPLTSKYADIDPLKGNPQGNAYKTPPITDFDVTQRDISSFPFLTDANPWHWLDKHEHEKCFSKNAVNDLMQNKQAIEDKYYMFLKRILIPDQAYEAIGKATISVYANSDKGRKKFIDHKCKKTMELENVLMNTPEFLQYFINHPDSIKKIIAEFTEYNKDFDHADDHYLQVDLTQIIEKYNQLHDLAYINNRENEARQLGLKPQAVEDDRAKMEELALIMMKEFNNLYNKVLSTNVDITLKNEIQTLDTWINKVFLDKNHISAYKLGLMTNGMITARDNIKRLHNESIYKVLDIIINNALIPSGLNRDRVQKNVEANYQSNETLAAKIDKEKLFDISTIVANDFFWSKRGKPWQIEKIRSIIDEKQPPFNAWENIKNCVSPTIGGFFETAPHEDMLKLRKAILDNDGAAIAQLAEKANNELEIEQKARYPHSPGK